VNVFLSWAGEQSRQTAELLKTWLSGVLQASRPWVSSKDIDRGSVWFGEIQEQLRDTQVGIICLTKDNLERPWILFEAGALAKGLASNRVCTFLIDLKPSDIRDPLAQFNHTEPTAEGVLKLLTTLNRALGENQLPEQVLERVFRANWSEFEQRFQEILNTTVDSAPPPERRSTDDLLEEILTITRNMSTRLHQLEDDSSAKMRVLRDKNLNYVPFKWDTLKMDEATRGLAAAYIASLVGRQAQEDGEKPTDRAGD